MTKILIRLRTEETRCIRYTDDYVAPFDTLNMLYRLMIGQLPDDEVYEWMSAVNCLLPLTTKFEYVRHSREPPSLVADLLEPTRQRVIKVVHIKQHDWPEAIDVMKRRLPWISDELDALFSFATVTL